MALQAVIFDSDGTLLDTREFIYLAYEQTLALHGHRVPPRTDMVTHMGKTLRASYESLATEGDIEAMMQHHRKLHEEDLIHLVAGYEGLHELLAHIRALGIKIGVCTSRGKHAEVLLERVGVLDQIDVIVTGDDVENHKPHPEAVLNIARQMHIAPEETVMVGDTTADIGAGIAAGCAFTIGVTHGFSSEAVLRGAGATHIAHHLNDIPDILTKHT